MHLMDYHHHTNHSFDSKAIMSSVCLTAIERNIQEICFTEHYSLNPLAPTYGHIDFDHYFQDIQHCRHTYQDQLTIKAGIEICEPHLLKDSYKDVLSSLPFDFVLGSIHNLHNQKLRLVIAEHHEEANKLYFNEVKRMVEEADIDVIAHLDLIKRYSYQTHGIYDFSTYKNQISDILSIAIERNIGIEINTSGLRSTLNEPLPSIDILKLYKKLGGTILTIGSDSHAADTVGAHLTEAYMLAKECGFTHVYSFEKRKPKAIKL